MGRKQQPKWISDLVEIRRQEWKLFSMYLQLEEEKVDYKSKEYLIENLGPVWSVEERCCVSLAPVFLRDMNERYVKSLSQN